MQQGHIIIGLVEGTVKQNRQPSVILSSSEGIRWTLGKVIWYMHSVLQLLLSLNLFIKPFKFKWNHYPMLHIFYKLKIGILPVLCYQDNAYLTLALKFIAALTQAAGLKMSCVILLWWCIDSSFCQNNFKISIYIYRPFNSFGLPLLPICHTYRFSPLSLSQSNCTLFVTARSDCICFSCLVSRKL